MELLFLAGFVAERAVRKIGTIKAIAQKSNKTNVLGKRVSTQKRGSETAAVSEQEGITFPD